MNNICVALSGSHLCIKIFNDVSPSNLYNNVHFFIQDYNKIINLIIICMWWSLLELKLIIIIIGIETHRKLVLWGRGTAHPLMLPIGWCSLDQYKRLHLFLLYIISITSYSFSNQTSFILYIYLSLSSSPRALFYTRS